MSDADRQRTHKRLDDDFSFFARHTLKIKDKGGLEIPFVLNRAQRYLDKKLEDQLQAIGRVRALVLKGRQQGCSTYIGARYYHKAVRKKNKAVFILSHETNTTRKLFKMVERFYENSPAPARPEAKVANRAEYVFGGIGSEYAVGTAGNDSVGRGGTVQLFHGSEVGFWEKTDGIETGILQSVADIDDTEIILESTANGMSNMFFSKCMEALEGKSDYQLIFIPWYWQDEYQRDIPSDGEFQLTEEEEEYKKNYELTNQQIYWRRSKLYEFGKGDIERGMWKFRQEYPAHVMEAFQTSGDPLIDPEAIMLARKSTVTDPDAPLIMGVDPGRNKDRTVFTYRRGREILDFEEYTFDKNDTVQMRIAGKIAQRIDAMKPVKVFIDVGEGYGVRDRLVEMGYGRVVEFVQFGANALEKELYLNRRAEMWSLLKNWLEREEGEVSIPDSDLIQRDLSSMPEAKATSNGRIQMESKDKIKVKLGMSPDIGDAMALTFAMPVKRDGRFLTKSVKIKKKTNTDSPLSILNKIRNKGKIVTRTLRSNRRR